ncbi:MAG: hypothetical protein LBD05_03025 [Mycoplasmataceae bacterium]|nr:hypothetical protein [Mycoplasmataceae bacterium]
MLDLRTVDGATITSSFSFDNNTNTFSLICSDNVILHRKYKLFLSWSEIVPPL